jgi:hypothetical protein
MRRSLEYCFNAVSALLFSLLVIVLAFWTSGFGLHRSVNWEHWTLLGNRERQTIAELTSGNGGFALRTVWVRRAVNDPQELSDIQHASAVYPTWKTGHLKTPAYPVMTHRKPSHLNELGFYGDIRLDAGTWGYSSQRLIAAPAWFLAALFSLVPCAWVVRRTFIRRETYRQEHGLCASCGYDLRATPHQCPECGAMRNTSK